MIVLESISRFSFQIACYLAFAVTLSDNVAPDFLFEMSNLNRIFLICDGGHIFAWVSSVMMRNVGQQFILREAAV